MQDQLKYLSGSVYLMWFHFCGPPATKNKAMQNQHREAPGFAVGLLSQPSVLDCTKAQSCLLLLCIFNCWSCKSPGLIFHRASAQWQVQVCLRMLEKFPVCLWLSNFTLLWVVKKYVSVIVKCLIEQSKGSVKKSLLLCQNSLEYCLANLRTLLDKGATGRQL